jgi:hypothetical protein
MSNLWNVWHKPFINQRGSLPVFEIWIIIYVVTGYELGGVYGYPVIGAVVSLFIGNLFSLIIMVLALEVEELVSDMIAGMVAVILLAPIYFFVSAQNRVWYLLVLCLMRWVIFVIAVIFDVLTAVIVKLKKGKHEKKDSDSDAAKF